MFEPWFQYRVKLSFFLVRLNHELDFLSNLLRQVIVLNRDFIIELNIRVFSALVEFCLSLDFIIELNIRVFSALVEFCLSLDFIIELNIRVFST